MKNILSNFKLITLGIIAAIILSYTYTQAASWINPPANAPQNNTFLPINVGVQDQVKESSLSVNAFIAEQNAQFEDKVFMLNTVFGGSPTDTTSTVYFGGVDPVDNNLKKVNINMYGDLSAVTGMQSDSLIGPDTAPLCVTSDGTLIRCQSTPSTINVTCGSNVDDDPASTNPQDSTQTDFAAISRAVGVNVQVNCNTEGNYPFSVTIPPGYTYWDYTFTGPSVPGDGNHPGTVISVSPASTGGYTFVY